MGGLVREGHISYEAKQTPPVGHRISGGLEQQLPFSPASANQEFEEGM